jgi:hypothetical protein
MIKNEKKRRKKHTQCAVPECLPLSLQTEWNKWNIPKNGREQQLERIKKKRKVNKHTQGAVPESALLSPTVITNGTERNKILAVAGGTTQDSDVTKVHGQKKLILNKF